MKHLLFFISTLICVNTFAAGWKTVTGNGNIKTESRPASGYSAVSLSGNMNVEISYGNSQTISIEANENLLPYIETVVENGKLEVKTKTGYNLKSKSKMMVYVSVKQLKSAQLSGSGNITGKGKFSTGSETIISLSGSGNIELELQRLQGLIVKVSGSGNVMLKGEEAEEINAQISGSGNIDCSSIKAAIVAAQVSGSGNVKVYATDSIDAKIAGSGNVYYKGDAAKINAKRMGSGRIIKA